MIILQGAKPKTVGYSGNKSETSSRRSIVAAPKSVSAPDDRNRRMTRGNRQAHNSAKNMGDTRNSMPPNAFLAIEEWATAAPPLLGVRAHDVIDSLITRC